MYPPVLAAIGNERLGAAMAERMLLTGDSIDVDAAECTGIITLVVGDGDTSAEADALEWYRHTLAPLSACAIRQSTAAIRYNSTLLERLGQPLRRIERNYVDVLLRTHDASEGIEAFINKRAPKWEDM